MARYIDADKFISWVDVGHLVPPAMKVFSELDVKSMIDKQPAADVVEVVRCKDCEHGQYMPSCSMYLCRCTGWKLRYADDYCNYGERKDTDEQHS